MLAVLQQNSLSTEQPPTFLVCRAVRLVCTKAELAVHPQAGYTSDCNIQRDIEKGMGQDDWEQSALSQQQRLTFHVGCRPAILAIDNKGRALGGLPEVWH